MTERGIYLPESLPEEDKVPWEWGWFEPHKDCIVVYELDGYDAKAVEVYPFFASDKSLDKELEAMTNLMSSIPNRVLKIRPSEAFIRRCE